MLLLPSADLPSTAHQVIQSGTSWPAIRTKWAQMTGTQPAASTLPNRYVRLKANMVEFTSEEDEWIKEAKTEVEAAFEAGIWNQIAEAVVGKGGAKFSGLAVKKRFGELEKGEGKEV